MDKKSMPILLLIVGLIIGIIVGWLIFNGASSTGEAKGVLKNDLLPPNVVEKQADGSTLVNLNYKETNSTTGVTTCKKISQLIAPSEGEADSIVYNITCTGSCTGDMCNISGCTPADGGQCTGCFCSGDACSACTCSRSVSGATWPPAS